MSKTLNRSKSMKLTRSPRSQQSTPGIHSRPVANEEPSSRETRASGAHAENRPNTSGGTHRNRAALQQPNSGKAPPSPTVFWAAEVHSNQGAFSAPLEKAASQTANVLNWPLPAAPVQTTPSSRTQSPCNAEKREGVEDQAKGKVKRWKSLRGFFGGKKSPNEDASRLTPPFGDFSGLQSPAVAPNRLQATPTVTTRAWSDQQEKVPAKLNKDKPLPIVDPTQRTAPMPPTNHLRHQGFHGGHKYQGGTTTKPLIDVEIPPTEMERYSVMFGSLLRSNTQPNLLARRQGRGTRVNPLQVDAPKVSSVFLYGKHKNIREKVIIRRRETCSSKSSHVHELTYLPGI